MESLALMSWRTLPLLMACAILTVRAVGAQPVEISEFMAANASTLADEDGEYNDWIELHSAGEQPVDLQGWTLTDDSAFRGKWIFPSITIEPDDYLVLFASGKDRTSSVQNGNLHTNFALAREGEYLALSGPDGRIYSEFDPFPEQTSDVSYGLSSGDYVFFVAPSPGMPNGGGASVLPQAPLFSAGHGLYDEPFDLHLTSPTPGVNVRYTLDGSEPTSSTGILYTKPVFVDRTTVVRAASFSASTASDVETRTFIFPDQVLTQGPNPTGYPQRWAENTPADYEMDAEVVADSRFAPEMRAAITGLPALSIVMSRDDLFGSSGIYMNTRESGVAWERAANVELFFPDGTRGFNVGAGIRIHGGASREPNKAPKHSFRLYFRDQYGPTRLRYPLLGDDAAESFDQLVLRAGFNLTWIHWDHEQRVRALYTRDELVRRAQLEMGHASPRGRYVHLYVNGMYWGLYNVAERPNAAFAASYFGGAKEEYDALNSAQPVDGDRAAWDQMMAVAAQGFGTDAQYEAIQEHLDLENLADYFILNHYFGNHDWDHHNWYAVRKREAGARWQFLAWDSEHTMINLGDDVTGRRNAGNPSAVFHDLMQNSDFRMLFADRVYKHLTRSGALTPERVTEQFDEITDGLRAAVLAESARWGDYRRDENQWGNGPYFLYDRTHWDAERARLRDDYLPHRTQRLLAQYRSRGWYPSLEPPVLSHESGDAPAEGLTLSNPNGITGTIYYTTDGSDPRLPGGKVSSVAINAGDGDTVPIIGTTTVMARVWNLTQWSALTEATFFSKRSLANLVVSELMYHPPDEGVTQGDEFEFIEIRNTDSAPVDLTGVAFGEGISYAFSPGAAVDAGGLIVLAADATQFETKYGFAPFDAYAGQFDNAGERVSLLDPQGAAFIDFTYDDVAPWPETADGGGFSIVPVDPLSNADPNDPSHWRASSAMWGSPGAGDPDVRIPRIVVNELLAHTDPPQLDAVELYNPTDQHASIGGWYLTDDAGEPQKYRIPDGSTIAPGDFLVLDEDDFNPNPGVSPSFAFSALGESVYLYSTDGDGNLTGYRHGFAFGPSENGVSFGRYTNSIGHEHFVRQSAPTLGQENAAPRISPVVISEIMYNPLEGGDEFLEIVNTTDEPVLLYDAQEPRHTWRIKGIGYDLPEGVELDAGEVLLVVPVDPELFRIKAGLPASLQVVGPYTGQLDNGGETVALERPDRPNLDGGVPYVAVDVVTYDDEAPWPLEADGGGRSLEREDNAMYANDPAAWQASFSTGGSPGNPLPTDVVPERGEEMVMGFEVSAAYPNPFNPTTQLIYRVREPQHVQIDLFDMLGRRIEILFSGYVPAGQNHRVVVDGARLSSGAYIIRVMGDDFMATRRIVLVK